MRLIALLLLGIELTFAGMHSFQYFCTVISKGINLPEFTVVGMVDDQQLLYFDSNMKKAVPKAEWMRPNEGADHWDEKTWIVIDHYQEFKINMQNIMDLFNHSMSDVHTFQIMLGCELDDDGTNRGYYKFGYDGEDFISFDKNTLGWSAANAKADIIKNKWEANRAKAKYWKAYLENTCMKSLKTYLSYGKDTLERKVAPEVSLLQKDPWSPPSVICHATSFYPSKIKMNLTKNHEDHNENVNVSETLSNADGTFQKSISLSVKSEEWKKNPDVYRCVIQHVGAEREIVVTLNENNIKSNTASDDNTAIALGCVVVLTLCGVIITLIVWIMSKEVKSGNVKGSRDTPPKSDDDKSRLNPAEQQPQSNSNDNVSKDMKYPWKDPCTEIY